MEQGAQRLAVVLALAAGVVTVATGVVLAVSPAGSDIAHFAVCVGLAVPAMVLGLVVARRRPVNVVGPLLVMMGLAPCVVGLLDIATTVAARRPGVLPGASVIAALDWGVWPLWYLPVALLTLYFPDGSLPSRRWRVVVVGMPVLIIALALPQTAGDDGLPNMFAIVLLAAFLSMLVATATALVRRYRRADGVRRAQLTWFVLGGMFLPATLLLCWASYLLLGRADMVLFGLAAFYLAIPAATAIAMLRHRLYDPGRALSATVAYTVVTAGLIGVFAAVSALSGVLAGRDSAVVAAVVTAICVIALAPARDRVQHVVDRRLYPIRGATLTALDALLQKVHSGQSEPEQVEAVLGEALRDPSLRVGYRLPGRDDLVSANGAALLSAADRSVPVRVGDVEIGVLRWTGAGSRELLREVAAACAVLVELVRLRIELAQALREVEVSRNRLQQIGYQERRRLERDLHDGAQQRLVTLGVALRLAQRQLRGGTIDVNGLLDHGVAELGTAVAELRQLAHGLRPSSLDDGLGPALAALTSTLPMSIELDISTGDLADDVVTTAYYVVAEAVANATKHAHAKRIAVSVGQCSDRLRVEVVDDGIGGAAPEAGSGLAGLSDRVAAAGGRLRVESPAGAGTRIEAELPCAS
ncbi:histidine kinase [Amycolatopsis sp. cg13]|uniref:sensor histidine kinase n=1 Tax=Amycolatopsis sp. cg13 TaxID=3238807 RepID=UPI0035260DE3